MDYNRLYEFRFRNVSKQKKLIVWKEISQYIYRKLDNPQKVLDPAAGECEFINSIASAERWALDLNGEFLSKHAADGVTIKVGDCLKAELPEGYFDAVFMSNFLEHLDTPEDIFNILSRMHKTLRKGGKIAILGPNFKYCMREYFNFADHKLIITESSLEEYLYSAGFDKINVIARFIPFSFQSRLPVNRFIVKTYLAFPVLWRFFGKQFLLIAEK
jgi:ubiquinone/menaquinone biosynthesis C-methylase UbiE